MPEFNQKQASGNTVCMRVDVPEEIHQKIMKHKFDLTGRLGKKQNITDAAIDLLREATKNISPVT